MREIKCRCYSSDAELREAVTELRRRYSGRIETRKATNGAFYPYFLIVDVTPEADRAALEVDRLLGSKWGDYHISGIDRIHAVSMPYDA